MKCKSCGEDNWVPDGPGRPWVCHSCGKIHPWWKKSDFWEYAGIAVAGLGLAVLGYWLEFLWIRWIAAQVCGG